MPNVTSITLMLLALLLGAGEAQTGDQPTTALEGTWNLSRGGTLTIDQDGDQVSGTIAAPDGLEFSLSGQVEGRTYRCTMSATIEGEQLEAQVTMTLSANEQTMEMATTFQGSTETSRYRIDGRTLVRD
jgi:hypothetical protein